MRRWPDHIKHQWTWQVTSFPSLRMLPAKLNRLWHRGAADLFLTAVSLKGRGLKPQWPTPCRNDELKRMKSILEKFLSSLSLCWAHFSEEGTVLGTGDLVINDMTSLGLRGLQSKKWPHLSLYPLSTCCVPGTRVWGEKERYSALEGKLGRCRCGCTLL